MNVYFILVALSSLNLIGNNLPGALYLTGYAEGCTPSDRSSIILGFIFSLLQLSYLARILKLSVKAANADQIESEMIEISPKLFPAFIYQIYFVAMTSISHLTSESACTPISLQQIGFKITAGIYAYFWIRGGLFSYTPQIRSRLLVLATQAFTFLMAYFFESLLRLNYRSSLSDCNHLSQTGLLLISTIFAFISISFLAFGSELIGFILSLPLSYLFWKSSYMMRAIGSVVEYSGGEFSPEKDSSCPHSQLDLMLWTLPFILWFFFSITMTLVRFILLRRAQAQNFEQSPEPLEQGSPLRAKVFGKHKLPPRISEEKTCSICWEEFNHEENVSFVEECFHIYHSSCINKWITHGSQCPLCKRKIQQHAI